MKDTYTIDEILSAVEDLQSAKKKSYTELNKSPAKFDNSDIPLNTLSLIEEAEKNIEN